MPLEPDRTHSARSTPAILAIVPAAGRSRRMGCPKQWLDLNGRPLLVALLCELGASDVDGIVVVTYAEITNRLETLALSKVFIAHNDDPHSEMIDSIRIGLAAWRARRTIHEDDGFLVCPADHPGLSREVFDACLRAFRSSSDKIVVASHQGRRGHPILFAGRYVGYVESAACDAGLNVLVRNHPNEVMTIECASPGVTRDLDSPEDYEDFTREQ